MGIMAEKVSISKIASSAAAQVQSNLVDPFRVVERYGKASFILSSKGYDLFAYIQVSVVDDKTIELYQSLSYYSEEQDVPASRVIATARQLAKHFDEIAVTDGDNAELVTGDLQKILDYIGDREFVSFMAEGLDGSKTVKMNYTSSSAEVSNSTLGMAVAQVAIETMEAMAKIAESISS